METRTWKRFSSCLLALTMVLSSTALPASAATPGKDGSAEMNEAYAAHESLMPIGPSFSVATLLEWTPESDPDARYSRASIPLADRKGGFVVNPKANPEAKLMLCSLANSSHDTTGAQGNENFMSWSFNYWQYTDSFVYWSGSEEGLICCPTSEFTDAAHTNGVPVVATLGFPWGSGAGYVEEVDAFCQKAADGSFPVADKLLEVMEYYGFDGYFFNQESYNCSAEIASRLDEMIRYMRAKCPDILISWYDSMLPTGNVSYQNAVNSQNQRWMERSDDGSVGINEFFMNYNWYDTQISTTVNTMNSIGRSPYDAFAGLDVQQNGMNTPFRDELLVDENGKLKLSIALYCPNSTLGNSADGAQFHEVEQDFYVNSASDPRAEVADISTSTWQGMSRFFADKTPILGAPFVTNFNSGHGTGYYVDGELSRDGEWSYQSVQDVMPTWTWIIDSEGSRLSGSYDFTDAYNGGTSIAFLGDLDANAANDIMLYSTDVTVADGMKLSLTAKNDDGKARLVAYYGDESTAGYEDCETVAYDLAASEADTWTTTAVDISDHAGKTLYAIGLKVESDTAVSDYQINLGQLAILDQDRAALSGPASVTLDEILYHNAYDAEARIYWDAVDGAASYEIYKVKADGTSSLIMETPNTAFYLPTLVRDFDEEDVTLKVVPVNANGVRGEGAGLVIDWLYGNDDSDVYEEQAFENVCLGAEVTDVSSENESEPASKAIDGTSLNGSKWCASNQPTGYMDIDIGREVTVRRWRVEHAQYGGEDVLMNTVDFALEYKTAEGEWKEAKRIQNNTAAVTDVLLDEPVTAQEWRLRIYDDGNSPWGGIRIYEWQMFETATFPQTEPVSIQFAAAENGTGANDTFTLKKVPVGQTVKVYTRSGSEYTMIGEAVAENSTVTITGLDFGTAEAGRIYYTTTAAEAGESIKLSARFEAENAEKSAPVTADDVQFEAYSQPDSGSSSNGSDIFISLTVNGLSAGDVVYVYEAEPLTRAATDDYIKASLPVAEGENTVTIHGIRVPRAGSKLALQVKRAGKLISDKFTVETPEFPEPTAFLNLVATNAKGEELTGVTYGVYNDSDEKIRSVTTGEPAEVVLGTYALKCESVPEGYAISDTVVKRLVVTEGQTYDVNVTLQSDSTDPIVTSVTVSPATVPVEKGATKQFAAVVNGENITDQSVTWSVSGAAAEATVIDVTGLLTVAEDETAEQLTVVATSVQDPKVSGSATVTVTEPVGELELVSRNAAIVGYNGKNLGADQGPEKLFDGDKVNPDTGKWCEEGSNLWVAFDIGEERDVRQLVVSHVGVAENPTPSSGSMNTANYEFFVLNEEKVNVDDLLAMEAEERNAVLADAANWKELAKTTDNAANVTTNDLGDATGRVFKLNVSRTDTTGWDACVRIYEAELYAAAKPIEPVVDKTMLNQLIEQASTLVEDEYTTTSWAAFAAALDQAKAVSAAEDANQEGVTAAAAALKTAMDGLAKRADNSDLVAAIGSIKELDESKYQPDSWAALAQALAEAEKVAADRDATDEAIETARANLEAAYKALVLRADMTELNNAVSYVEALDQALYSADSWKRVAEALEAARTVAGNANATQEAVDAAARALQAAVAALEKAGDTAELDKLLQQVREMDLSKYTAASAAAIRQAVSDAEAAIANCAGEEDLKAAFAALKKAVDSAELKPPAPEPSKPAEQPVVTPAPDEHPDIAEGITNGTWGGKPTATPGNGSTSSATNNAANNGADNSANKVANNKVPQTSDDFPYMALIALVCVAAGGIGVLLYAKKRKSDR